MMEKLSAEEFDLNYKNVIGRLERAIEKSGRDKSEVTLLAATKTVDTDTINYAIDSGIEYIGENRVQELLSKYDRLKPAHSHFIGHLQTNKVNKVVRYFDYIQSVDSLHLAEVISESAKVLDKVQKVLLQINISGEVQKFGFSERELYDNFEKLLKLSNLDICGFMCMAPLGASDKELDEVFKKAEQIKTDINKKYSLNLKELSMGMSDDYERAVANGATMIRLGRILFK